MWPRVEGFSTIGGGIVAVSEPGVALVGLGAICPLRVATTGGSAYGSVESGVCSDAARNGERPCASGIIRGSEGRPVGAGEESSAIWETSGTLSLEEEFRWTAGGRQMLTSLVATVGPW